MSYVHFKQDNYSEILQFIKANNFEVLLSSLNNYILGTHLPFIVEDLYHCSFKLTTHLAATNLQIKGWKNQQDALVIFNDTHAYVSPSLYEKQLRLV